MDAINSNLHEEYFLQHTIYILHDDKYSEMIYSNLIGEHDNLHNDQYPDTINSNLEEENFLQHTIYILHDDKYSEMIYSNLIGEHDNLHNDQYPDTINSNLQEENFLYKLSITFTNNSIQKQSIIIYKNTFPLQKKKQKTSGISELNGKLSNYINVFLFYSFSIEEHQYCAPFLRSKLRARNAAVTHSPRRPPCHQFALLHSRASIRISNETRQNGGFGICFVHGENVPRPLLPYILHPTWLRMS
ncbi:hypothetical protein J6590_058741 [Homalodisca vitripennis]|nr:hypothetical protein J6590_058741 [Homalodisca vitripennis]